MPQLHSPRATMAGMAWLKTTALYRATSLIRAGTQAHNLCRYSRSQPVLSEGGKQRVVRHFPPAKACFQLNKITTQILFYYQYDRGVY